MDTMNSLKLSYFYYQHSELVVKYNIWLKALLQHGISEPVFYGNLIKTYKKCWKE